MFNSSRRLSIGAVVALLLASFGFTYSVSAVTPQGASEGPPSVVKFEHLGPGRVLVRWSNGLVYTGSPGVQISMTTWTNPDGTGGSGQISISTGANLESEADLERAANAYRADGRSLAQDEATIRQVTGGNFPVNNATPSTQQVAPAVGDEFRSGCASSGSDTHVYAYGCYQRYHDGSYSGGSYIVDTSKASGYDKNSYHELTGLKVVHGYNPTATIIDWDPYSDQTTGSCYTLSVGIDGAGLSFPFCPDGIQIDIYSPTFWAKWHGGADHPTVRGVAASTKIKVPNGTSNTLSFVLGWSWL